MKKFGIIVLTDYQLFNVFKFVYFNCENSKGNTDLFVCESIKNIDLKIEKLLATNLFSNVIKVKNIKYSKNIIVRKFNTIKYSIFDKKVFSKFIDGKKVTTNKYQILITPCATLMCEIFCNFFIHDEIYYIEDGLGSYFGNIQNRTLTKLHRAYLKITGGLENISKLYVNNKEFCKSTVTNFIFQIPGEIDNNFRESICKIFMYNNIDNKYSPNDIVYLQQPLQDFGVKFVKKEIDILKRIYNFADNKIIIREHPRSNVDDSISYIRKDKQSAMWEIVLLNNITDSNFLIGMFSTAQMTPKILYNKEPYIIFLFNIFPLKQKVIIEEEKMFNDLKNIYKAKEKVVAPKTVYELEKILEIIKN